MADLDALEVEGKERFGAIGVLLKRNMNLKLVPWLGYTDNSYSSDKTA